MLKYIKATYQILKYGAADLDFDSCVQFGKYSRFMNKYFKWDFYHEVLYGEYDPEFFTEINFLFVGAKNKQLLESHENYR